MSQHTRGPWHRSTIGSHHGCRLIFGTDGLLVADAGRIQKRTDDEMDANADLIAAAPELLAALERVTSVYEQRLRELGYDDRVIAGGCAARARAAIAKAKGGGE